MLEYQYVLHIIKNQVYVNFLTCRVLSIIGLSGTLNIRNINLNRRVNMRVNIVSLMKFHKKRVIT